jgi:hypothetical protein
MPGSKANLVLHMWQRGMHLYNIGQTFVRHDCLLDCIYNMWCFSGSAVVI